MMMIANLIGFCVGLDGIVDLLKGILGSYYGIFATIYGLNDVRTGVCGSGVCDVICWCAGDVRDS
jgi:hypothetical protein